MGRTQEIKYGDVDLRKPHFFIYYSDTYDAPWIEIAVMKADDTNPVISLLGQFDDGIIGRMEKEVRLFLFETREDDPIGYLAAHCSMVSNVYGSIHFAFIAGD